MQRFIDGIIGAVAMLALMFGGAVLVLSLEKNAPQAPAVTGKGSPPSSLSQPAALSFPIPYSATVTQSGDGIKEPRTRFYVSRAVKEAE